MITMQGGVYLSHRTEGEIQKRTIRAVVGAAFVMSLAFIAAGIWLKVGDIKGYVVTSVLDPNAVSDPLAKTVERTADAWWKNYNSLPILWVLPALAVLGALGAAALAKAGRTLTAFMSSSLSIVGAIGTAGAAMFPFVMPSSSQPNASLTLWDSVSSHMTLGLMFWAALIFTPIVLLYTGWAYRVMRGKVTVADIKANEHSAY